jgi:DnaK suppressor protein
VKRAPIKRTRKPAAAGEPAPKKAVAKKAPAAKPRATPPAKKAAVKAVEKPAVKPPTGPGAGASEPAAPRPPAERSWSQPSATTTSLPPVQPGVPITKQHVAAVAAVLGLFVVRRRRRKKRR